MKRTFVMILLFVAASLAQQSPGAPPGFEGIGIEQHLNATIPLRAPFLDEQGATVTLRKFLGSHPVLLVPVYFDCPMLCNETLHGVVAGLRPLSLVPGRDFEVVVFSFNPAETSSVALKARDRYTQMYSGRAGTAGWHFLTASEDSIRAVTEAIGFRYRYDAVHNIFVHQSGVMILTPEGRLARYFYGVEYDPKDLKLGLVDASHGRIGSPVEKLLLYCYQYDPKSAKYSAAVIKIVQLACIAMVFAMAGVGIVLWKEDIFRQGAGGTKQ